MSKQHILLKLFNTNLKRLKKYIPWILGSVLILLGICATAGSIISKNIYKSEGFSKISIAYYLPKGQDAGYTSMAINILENSNSMEETLSLLEVDDIDEGYRLLDAGEVLFYVIIPDEFFSGIMYGDNIPLKIVTRGSNGISSYIVNELFSSYANYLGTAESGIYSVIDAGRAQNLTKEAQAALEYQINLVYVNRFLSKDSCIKTVDSTVEHGIALKERYLASALMIALMLMSFFMMSWLQGMNTGTKKLLGFYNVNFIDILAVNTMSSFVAYCLAFLPCFAGISLLQGTLNLTGPILAIPVLLIMSLIVSVIAGLSKGLFSANITVFTVTLILAYTGGGILPLSMLPSAVQHISSLLPGRYMIEALARVII